MSLKEMIIAMRWIAQQSLKSHDAAWSVKHPSSIAITGKLACQVVKAKLHLDVVTGADHRYAAALHIRA